MAGEMINNNTAPTLALLKTLTGKEWIKIVSRGNKAILYALRIAKKLGKTKLFIQEQGGWITYKQLPKKLGLEVIELKTDYGLLGPKEIGQLKDIDGYSIDGYSALLINTMPGYFAEQDINSMEEIWRICREKNSLLINDISGSIGTEQAKYGDILVCSFGADKPLNYGRGGLLAAEKKEWLSLTEIKEERLGSDFYEKILNLEKRLILLKGISKKIKEDFRSSNRLNGLSIIHRERSGINVIVKFNNEEERKQIEEYCKKNNYEYTLCPRYIRVNCSAISIEVKRLQ